MRTTTGGNFDTSVLAYEFYAQSFRSVNQGLGAALAVLIFVLVIADRRSTTSVRCASWRPDDHRRPERHVRSSPSSPKETVASSAHKALTSPWASIAAIVIAILWTIPTIGLLITSFRPEERHHVERLVDHLHQPRLHPGQLRPRCSTARPRACRTYFINSIVITHPGGADPDQPRDAGGVRLRVDEVPGPRLPLRGRLRPADRADPGDADPAAQPVRRRGPDAAAEAPGGGSTRSGCRTRSSRCRWRSSCCTTSCARSPAS